MRDLACKTLGLEGPLLGKVTRLELPKRQRHDHILVLDGKKTTKLNKYAAVLVAMTDKDSLDRQKCKIPLVLAESTSDLHDGDVLLIEPERNTATFVYESQSPHNAIMVTWNCNCKCLMCPQPPEQGGDNRTEFNKRLIRLMAPGPNSLAFTGGEPTLVGDDLISLVDECRKRLPETYLIILSNGRLFKHREYVEKLARIPDSRLTIAIPIYADTDTQHDRIVGAIGAFRDTILGLHNLALYGVTVEIRVVILALNYERLVQLAAFIYRNLPFATHVAFMGLETTGLAETNISSVWVNPCSYASHLEEACRFLRKRMIRVSVYNHQLCVLPRALWPISPKSISEWKRTYLPQCEKCVAKEGCGGFFESSAKRLSPYILPIKNLTLS